MTIRNIKMECNINVILAACLICISGNVVVGMSIEKINDKVNITGDGDQYLATMDENNHDFDTSTQLFKIAGVDEDCSSIPVAFLESANFTYEIKTDCIFYATQSFDYESNQRNYLMTIGKSPSSVNVRLVINNIDDEDPEITSIKCSFNEYTDYTLANSTCTCIVKDPDGWLNTATFQVYPGTSAEDTIFAMDYTADFADTITEADVTMYLKTQLHYEEINMYSFTISVTDPANHVSPTQSAVVSVVDLRNTNPIWTNIKNFMQFNELEPQKYTVTATDGDTGINQKIYYYKVSEDNQDENYISIEKETGLVNVKPIDRDKYDMLLYNFILSACVSDAPDYCSEEKCQFYIIDIDNQIPNITKNIWTDSDKVVEYGDDDKIVELSYLENYEGNYNFTTTISDRDTGENAQFTVALVNVDEGGEVDFTEPYLVVPGTGYRSGNFTISVRDKTYLDFENETWKEHQYYVVSTGTLNTSHTDKLLVKVTLEDYNDEYPIFEKTEYSTEILETAKKGENVLTAHATDRDAEDKVLTMEILGTYAQSRLNINSDGEITVSIDDAFDYDTLNSIYFQVTATDKGNHTVSVPVTITLLDVNNKAPTINPVKPVEVEENQPNGSILNISITASDVDQTGNLTSRIDWNNSYVTKNNIQKDITDEVKTAMQFLEVQNEQGNGGRNLTVSLVVINNDDDKPNKPDYETFDTLYLSLIVEDQNTDKDFENNRETSTTVTITIIDINDNPPYFPDSNVENRTVQELASQGTSVGFLKALDPDTVSTNITYSCTAVDDSQDWVEINAITGAFTVKDEGQVNADDPITWYFNYTCAASDQEFKSDPLIVAFYIIDTNSETPVNDLPSEVSVTEKSPKDTLISEIPTSDKDRDIPFHTVVCSFDLSDTDNTPVCIKKFQITDNNLRVLNGGDDIDRDRGQPNFTCSISCSDNPNGDRNQPRKTVTQQVKIILEDINDNKPELITTELDCSENLKAEEMMGYIIGRDIDEGVNSDITFSITSITGTANVPQLSILKDDDYRINETYKQVQLRPDEDLKGFYGSYVLNLFMEDGGTPSQSDNGILTLTIERFNYHTPTIVYPEESTSAITLLSSQTPNSPLILFPTGNMLPNFVATDGETNDCSKWNVTFTIKQNNYENNQIFTIAYLTGCEAQLQVNDNFKTEDALRNIFELTVTAWVVQDGTPKESEAPYYTSVNIKVTFLDNGMQPFFPDTTPWVVKFPENNAQQSIALPQNATYNVSDTSELPPILYYLISDVKRHYELFEVDPDTGTLSVKDIFYYDEDKEFDFQIMASNDSNTDISNDVNSTLSVTVLVQSTNRRPPQWENPPFFGAAMPGFVSGNVILTAQASDPDAIDQGNLVCSISGEIIPSATGVDNIGDTPFYVKTENDMAQVNLNFTVENTMSGYFTFMIAVEDHDDNYGNKAHKVEASATIFIITTENTVDFGFYNNISDVQNNEIEMLEIVADVVGYNAYRQSIFSSTSTTGEDLSTARLYFIQTDGGTVTLITRETILKIVGNLNTFATLANRLRSEQGLMLTSFGSTSTGGNSEAALRAWLTGVSVVMGVVCCILLVTLILKTKQLNKRISKLTTKQFGSQESGLNRLGVTAPTTNKHAIEGSNPVYKNEDFRKPNNKMNELDTQSIRSGDSDLIGIENNPEFDYNFNNPRDDKTTYL